MISTRVLRRRIRSIQSTAKITRAMEMIATAKMRRAQDQALAGRPYSDKITQVIADLAAESSGDNVTHPLLKKRKVNKIAVIHITSDRGLCGGLNANMNRLTGRFILEQKIPVTLVTVGKKGRDFMFRQRQDVRAEFTKISDRPAMLDTLPISRIITDDYSTGYVDQVYLAYTRFVTTMVQNPTLELLLPIEPAPIPKTETKEYIYEPDPAFVLNELLPRFVEMRVYHAILEAIASEQSARMVAMRSATDNANDVMQELTLILNKARQEMITTELLDITGGVESLH
ncbi:MAG TPA: ATP synthase F1 subunit gamma [Dehalococcoidia bacterium]